ncbi:MAG: DUF5615 family PIN-like protein [Planctomycetota bacterium]|nr:DUF5615 family PIN-like protein [Planctomycetota bacterium]
MKLLFDQNLSHSLANSLAELFPGSMHLRGVTLERADDETVWDYAKQHGYIIISKDSDFRQRSFLRGSPPKIIWLNVGNCSTRQIERLLRQFSNQIIEFTDDPMTSFLELH